MSCLFREREGTPASGQRWVGTPLESSVLRVPIGGSEIVVTRFGAGTEVAAALLAFPGLRVAVNGLPILGGLKVLDHRDEIMAGGQRFVFSEETPPEITSFRAEPGGRELRCSLCRGVIREGMAVVRCPRCARLFHQDDASLEGPERHCWTYSDRCRHCGHPTALSGESLWSPDQEESDV